MSAPSNRRSSNKIDATIVESTPKRGARSSVQEHKKDHDEETEQDAEGSSPGPSYSLDNTPVPSTSSAILTNTAKPHNLPHMTDEFVSLYTKRATAKTSQYWFKASKRMKNVVVLEHQLQNNLKPSDLATLDNIRTQPMSVPDITAPLYKSLNEAETTILTDASNAIMAKRLETHKQATETLRNQSIAEAEDTTVARHYLDHLAKANAFPKNTEEHRAATDPITIAYICSHLQNAVTQEALKFSEATVRLRAETSAKHNSFVYRQSKLDKRKLHPKLTISDEIINTTTHRDTTIPNYFSRVEPPAKQARKATNQPQTAPPDAARAPKTAKPAAAPSAEQLALEADARAFRALMTHQQNAIERFPHSHSGYYRPGIAPTMFPGFQPHMHEPSFVNYTPLQRNDPSDA